MHVSERYEKDRVISYGWSGEATLFVSLLTSLKPDIPLSPKKLVYTDDIDEATKEVLVLFSDEEYKIQPFSSWKVTIRQQSLQAQFRLFSFLYFGIAKHSLCRWSSQRSRHLFGFLTAGS